MTAAEDWASRLRARLTDVGVDARQVDALAADAMAEALSEGAEPADLFGPAVSYAGTLARIARSADHPPPLHREVGPVVLRLQQVTKRYRRRDVLRGIDLTLRAGEVAAVVGANGSGKSTLLRICAGLTKATTGSVERTASMGYSPQHEGVSGFMTADDHFRLFGAAYKMRPSESVVIGRGLAARLGWSPREGVVAAHLSGGTQQKLNVVLGELGRPELILLDEPYQGFDEDSYLDFWEQVFRWRDGGAGVLVVTHLLRDVDRVDHVLELRGIGE